MFGHVRVNRVVASIVDSENIRVAALICFNLQPGFPKIDMRQSTPNSAGL